MMYQVFTPTPYTHHLPHTTTAPPHHSLPTYDPHTTPTQPQPHTPHRDLTTSTNTMRGGGQGSVWCVTPVISMGWCPLLKWLVEAIVEALSA